MTTKEIKDYGLPIQCNDKCPFCGSEERIAEEVIKAMKAEGKLGDKYRGRLKLSVILFDPAKPQLLKSLGLVNQSLNMIDVPILEVYWDICNSCKKMYPTSVELGKQSMMSMPGR